METGDNHHAKEPTYEYAHNSDTKFVFYVVLTFALVHQLQA